MRSSNLGLRNEELDDPHASAELLPSQFTELLHTSSGRSPEVSLMAAVLHDAIRSFCECKGSRGARSRRLFDETAEWFASADDGWPFAFENICAVLNLEPEWIRGLLRRFQDDVSSGEHRPTTVRRIRLRVAGRRRPIGAGALRLVAS